MKQDTPIHINANFHTALNAHKKDTGRTKRAVVHMALQEYFERYVPELVPVLKGEEPDESKALAPFENI